MYSLQTLDQVTWQSVQQIQPLEEVQQLRHGDNIQESAHNLDNFGDFMNYEENRLTESTYRRIQQYHFALKRVLMNALHKLETAPLTSLAEHCAFLQHVTQQLQTQLGLVQQELKNNESISQMRTYQRSQVELSQEQVNTQYQHYSDCNFEIQLPQIALEQSVNEITEEELIAELQRQIQLSRGLHMPVNNIIANNLILSGNSNGVTVLASTALTTTTPTTPRLTTIHTPTPTQSTTHISAPTTHKSSNRSASMIADTTNPSLKLKRNMFNPDYIVRAAEGLKGFYDRKSANLRLRNLHHIKQRTSDNKQSFVDINLDHYHLKVKASNANSLILIPDGSHGARPVQAIETYSLNRISDRIHKDWEPIIGLFNSVGQNMIIEIAFLLSRNVVAFELIFEFLLRYKQRKFASAARRVLHNISHGDTLSIDRVLRIKEAIYLSDKSFYLFTSYLGLTNGYLPCKTLLVERRLDITRQCIETFEVKVKIAVIDKKIRSAPAKTKELYETGNRSAKKRVVTKIIEQHVKGAYLNPLILLDFIIAAGDMKDLVTKEIKFSFDGSVRGRVLATLSPLNSPIMKTQDRDACFTMVSYDGPENKEALNTFIKPVALHLNERHDSIDIVFVPDLAGLAKVSNLKEDDCFCIYCKCNKNAAGLFNHLPQSRELKLLWEIKNMRVMWCVLHAKMRLFDNIVRAIVIKGASIDPNITDSEKLKEKITERIRMIPVCPDFKFRSTNQNSKQKEETNDCDQDIEDMPFTNGVQVDAIFASLENVFEGVILDEDLKLLKMIRAIIYGWLVAPQYELELPERDIDKYYRPLLTATGNLIQMSFGGKSMGHYFHLILVHSAHVMQQITYEQERLLKLNEIIHSEDNYLKEYAESLIQDEGIIMKHSVNLPKRPVLALIKYCNEAVESNHHQQEKLEKKTNIGGGRPGKDETMERSVMRKSVLAQALLHKL
jgi:hypothetical protein